MTNEEQREHKRLQTRVKIEFRLAQPVHSITTNEYAQAITRDISAGGVFIETQDTEIAGLQELLSDDFLLFKTPIELRISIPACEQPILAIGKVVWIEKQIPGMDFHHGVAISFTEISHPDRKTIDNYVLSRST
jgi:c-di-GMP-binding flagellar brake protein YcgR